MFRRSFLKFLGLSATSITANASLPDFDDKELSSKKIIDLIYANERNEKMLLAIHDKLVEMENPIKRYRILKAFKTACENNNDLAFYSKFANATDSSKYGYKKAFKQALEVCTDNNGHHCYDVKNDVELTSLVRYTNKFYA